MVNHVASARPARLAGGGAGLFALEFGYDPVRAGAMGVCRCYSEKRTVCKHSNQGGEM